jgi:parvulin-like peptidyl-prolyl isomerase
MKREQITAWLKRYHIGAVLLGGMSIVLVLLVLSLLGAYVFPERWAIAKKIRSEVPFPAVVVDYRNAVPLRDLSDNLSSVKRFYESQDFSKIGMRVDFSTEEGKMRLKIREREIVNKMVEDAAIRSLAERQGVRITEAAAAAEVTRVLQAVGDGKKNDAQDRLNRLYGWNLPEFERKVVLPSLYQEELRKRFVADQSNFAPAKARIAEAKQALVGGKGFESVAKEFSEGRTAGDGGMLGWFAYGDLAPELQEPVKSLSLGVPSDIIESSLGFHILLVKERKSSDKGELVSVAQVFVPKETFADWLSGQMSRMNIRAIIPEYVWNKETTRVEFRDPAMREMEKKILESSTGDASFLL